jgi:hypothetical protein
MKRRPKDLLDRQIDAALKRARKEPPPPMAAAVIYMDGANFDCFVVRLKNGEFLALPRKDLQGLQSAKPKQLKNVKITALGTGLSWPDLDVDLYVPALVEGIYGNEAWMTKLQEMRNAAKPHTVRKPVRKSVGAVVRVSRAAA